MFGFLRSLLTTTASQPSAAMSAQSGTGVELCSFFIFNSTFGPREGEVSQILIGLISLLRRDSVLQHQ